MTTSIYELINSNSSPGAPLLLLSNILYLHNIFQLSNSKAPLPPCQIQVSKGNTHPIVITLHGHVRGRGGCIPLKERMHFHDPPLVVQPKFFYKAGEFYDPRPDPPPKIGTFRILPT